MIDFLPELLKAASDTLAHFAPNAWPAITTVPPVVPKQLATVVTPVAQEIIPWIPSLTNLLVWSAVGIFLDGIVLPLMIKAAEKNPWPLDEELLKCFQRKLSMIFITVALNLALTTIPMAEVPNYIKELKPFGHHFFVAAFILIISWWLSDIFISIVRYASSRVEALPSTSIFHNIIRICVMSLGMLVVLQTMGISILPVLTALGVGGLAVSLALKDTLENIFAGFQVIFSKQIRIGDYVRLDSGIEGVAEDIGWRNSCIRQLNENLVIVPNAKLAASIMTNFSRPGTYMVVNVEWTVGFQNDLQRVEQVAIEAARKVMKANENAVLQNRDPVVRFLGFRDQGINFKLFVQVKHYRDQYLLCHELVKAMHQGLAEAGISIYSVPWMPMNYPLPDALLEGFDPEALRLAAAAEATKAEAAKPDPDEVDDSQKNKLASGVMSSDLFEADENQDADELSPTPKQTAAKNTAKQPRKSAKK